MKKQIKKVGKSVKRKSVRTPRTQRILLVKIPESYIRLKKITTANVNSMLNKSIKINGEFFGRPLSVDRIVDGDFIKYIGVYEK